MIVREIFDFLNSRFPVETACDFDNVGILVGDPNKEITGVTVALDCTPAAVRTAIENRCGLIVTHHPVIFEPLKSVLAGSVTHTLTENGISVISMHTNLDVGVGGVNDSLAAALELCEVKKVSASDGYLLNTGKLASPMSSDELAKYIKKKLGGCVKFNRTCRPIENLLLCSGSGGGYLCEAVRFGCDAFVTADVKHNVFIDAEHLGVTVFDAGHFETEDVVTPVLKNMLEEHFGGLRVFACRSTSVSFV